MLLTDVDRVIQRKIHRSDTLATITSTWTVPGFNSDSAVRGRRLPA